MNLKNKTTERLLKILELYLREITNTSITKLDEKGRLYCDEIHRSPHSHNYAFLAWDELTKRGERKNHEKLMKDYTVAKERYEKWHGILCGRIIEHIIQKNEGKLPSELLNAANN